jgi:hypothetical protein
VKKAVLSKGMANSENKKAVCRGDKRPLVGSESNRQSGRDALRGISNGVAPGDGLATS